MNLTDLLPSFFFFVGGHKWLLRRAAHPIVDLSESNVVDDVVDDDVVHRDGRRPISASSIPTVCYRQQQRTTAKEIRLFLLLFLFIYLFFFVIDKKRKRKAPTVPKLGRTSNQKQGAVDCRSRPPRNPNFDCGENKKLGQTRSLSLSLYL